MEFFLWFWLLDKRFLCNMRPIMKNFSFLWLFPISFHLTMTSFNLYLLFPFKKNLEKSEYIILSFMTKFEIISIICLFNMTINLYNNSKNIPVQQKNSFTIVFEPIKTKEDKNDYIYYEDYWMARKNLLSYNGIIILVLSLIHIIWSFYYLNNKTRFQNIFKFGEHFVIFYSYLNIFFFAIIILMLIYAGIIKISFVLLSIFCTSFVVSISKKICKRNKGLKKTIDFSDVPNLKPVFIF